MLKSLIKVKLSSLLYSFITRNGKKRSTGMIVFTVIMLIYVLGVFTVMSSGLFGVIGSGLLNSGNEGAAVYFNLAAVIGFLIAVFGSTTLAIGQVYEAKDNDLLLSMPIKPSYILLSRMFLPTLYNSVFYSIVEIPALIVYIITAAIHSQLSIAIILRFIPFYISGIMLSTAFTMFLAWGISAITSKFNIKKFLYTVFLLVFLGGYFVIYSQMNKIMSNIVANISVIGEALRKYSGLFYLGGAGVAKNWLYWLIYIIVCCGVFALMYYLLSKSFIKIATSKIAAKKVIYKEKKLKASSAGLAIYKKEFKRLFTLPAYFINAGLGAILMLILPIVLSFNVNSISLSLTEMGISDTKAISAMIFAFAVCFCCIMTAPTACAVSLEGKTFYLLLSYPVSGKTICYAKLLFNITLGCVPSVLSLIVAMIIAKTPIVYVPFVLLLPLVSQIFSAYLGLITNLKRPNFDWTNPIIPIKQDFPMMISILGGMGIMMAVLIPCAILGFMVSPLIALALACIPYIIGLVIMAIYLDKKADKLIEDCLNK